MRLGALSALLVLAWALDAAPRVFVPVTLRPGSVGEVYVWDDAPVPEVVVEIRSAQGRLLAKESSVRLPDAAGKHVGAALVAVDVLTPPSLASVRVTLRDGTLLLAQTTEITPRTLPREVIALDRAMSQLREVPDPRKDSEANQIWAVYLKRRAQVPPVTGRFRLPVEGSASSAQFGDVRHYAYSDGTSAEDYHRGTDFAAPVGTPVHAPAAGVVRLAMGRLLTGDTVVLEHAPGLYSVYFHLSRIDVRVGQAVEVGQGLGLTGRTGLVTGPHLHWEVRLDGVPVDPLDLVTDGLLDKDRIAGLISSIEHKRG